MNEMQIIGDVLIIIGLILSIYILFLTNKICELFNNDYMKTLSLGKRNKVVRAISIVCNVIGLLLFICGLINNKI